MNNYEDWLKTIESSPELDGGGTILAPMFEKILSGKKFNVVFEWCAGPAWIGMWLLENKICKTLVTGDINGESVEYVRRSATKHGYDVRSYRSDNLNDIPSEEMFDLVVSNPPNYCNIQESHKLGALRHDLRPSDIDWVIHKDFYKNIGKHLSDNAVMFISEVEPYQKDFYLDGELYDKRPKIPMEEFIDMTSSNGLTIKRVIPYKIEDTRLGVLQINKI